MGVPSPSSGNVLVGRGASKRTGAVEANIQLFGFNLFSSLRVTYCGVCFGAVKAPLTRLDWIEAARAALVADGIEGVRVDRLCRDLGVTKGSFYHHFDGREGLLSAVADDWARERPRVVMDAARDLSDDPSERLVHFIRLAETLDLGRQHQAMRTWGAVDPRAAAAAREVDRVVLIFVEQALLETGLSKPDAGALARILLATAVGLQNLGDVVPEPEHADLARWLVHLVRERATSRSSGS